MLQASPPLSFCLLAFCLLFLSCISHAEHFSFFKCNVGASADVNLYVTQERRWKRTVWNSIWFLLSKMHHKFTSCHVRVSILLCINYSMETCASILQDCNALCLGCPCVTGVGGKAGKVSVTDRQTAHGSLAHVFLNLQLWVDVFTVQTAHRLQWVQTGIFNYSCGVFPINKTLRKKENCLLACLLPGFTPSCHTWAEHRQGSSQLLWK